MSLKHAVFASALLAQACAWNATGVAPPRTLIFEFTVEGDQIVQSPNIAYYLVIDADPGRDTGPQANGGVPLSFPYPDPRSYLPFMFDWEEKYTPDRWNAIVPPVSTWTTYFALYQNPTGPMEMWQGKPNEDGTINERYHQLQAPREWNSTGKTVQITEPWSQIVGTGVGDDTTPIPANVRANLIVANRGQAVGAYALVMERWGQVPNVFFTIPTNPVDQTVYDTISGVPADLAHNVPQGVDPRQVNFISYRYRIVAGS